jgi:hypothetical protein
VLCCRGRRIQSELLLERVHSKELSNKIPEVFDYTLIKENLIQKLKMESVHTSRNGGMMYHQIDARRMEISQKKEL